MGINFGNYQDNSFLVNNNDGYEEYRGLDGNDVYNVNTSLTDDVRISDSAGLNTIVLGNAAIESTDFVSAGVIFHYAAGGSLTVIGDVTKYNFVFGGGSDPFDPTSGGTDRSFAETASAFGVNPDNLSPSTIQHGTVTGTINSDGTVDSGGNPNPPSGDKEDYLLDGRGSVRDGNAVTIDASQEAYRFIDNSSAAENVIIQNFSEDDHLQINCFADAAYQITNEGKDVIITYNPGDGDALQIFLEDFLSNPQVLIAGVSNEEYEASLNGAAGFNVIHFQ